MNLPKYSGPRVKLLLGKYRVLRLTRGAVGFDIHLDFGNGKVMSFLSVPNQIDVREGDLMNIYTEVPIAIPRKTDA